MIPRDWKCGKAIPIHKQGDKTSLNKYRPVSLTSTCCKTLEQIIAKHLIDFVECNHFSGTNQYGFRQGCSTTTQLIEVFHNLSRIVDNRGQADVVLSDFAKAFDRVSHPKMLHKFTRILKNRPIVHGFEAHLSEGKQFAYLQNGRNNSLPVLSGIPQGLVLGPLLLSYISAT